MHVNLGIEVFKIGPGLKLLCRVLTTLVQIHVPTRQVHRGAQVISSSSDSSATALHL